MNDKIKPVVTDTVFGIRRTIQERYPGTTREGIEYDGKTGVGKTSHSTDDVDINITVTPKETKP